MVISDWMLLGILLLMSSKSAVAYRHLPPPTSLSTEVFPNQSVLVAWTNPIRNVATVSRVTFAPENVDYSIIKEVPISTKSVTIANLMPNMRYNVTLQNGIGNGVFGPKSTPSSFHLHPAFEGDASLPNVTTSWVLNPYENYPRSHTDEIIVVTLIILTWVGIVFWFFTKWAKIRVIEPRYFDYHFLMKYDKAFALQNSTTVAAGAGANGPRKSIVGGDIFLKAAARFSISAASTRNPEFPFLTSPVREDGRPGFLGVRQMLHRHSHDARMNDVRIELTEVSSNLDQGLCSPVSV